MLHIAFNTLQAMTLQLCGLKLLGYDCRLCLFSQDVLSLSASPIRRSNASSSPGDMQRCIKMHAMLPQEDAKPGQRDAEEFIEIHRVDIAELQRLMVSGDMLLPSMSTCFMSLQRLASLGLLPNL